MSCSDKSEMSESDVPFRQDIIRIATDLQAVELEIRKNGGNGEICNILRRSYLKLMKEAKFLELFRPVQQITQDELCKEIMDSYHESQASILSALRGASSFGSSADQEREETTGRTGNDALHVIGPKLAEQVTRIDQDSDGDLDENGYYSDGVGSDEEDDSVSEDVLDFLPLKETTASVYQSFVNRIKDAYFDLSSADIEMHAGGIHLLIGKCDIWSPGIILRSDFSRNKVSIKMLERQLSTLFVVLRPRSIASVHAKNLCCERLKKEHDANVKKVEETAIGDDLLDKPMSHALISLESRAGDDAVNETPDDEEEVKNPYYAAAERATDEADMGGVDWTKLVKFSRQKINQMTRCIHQKIMCVVLQLVPFREIAKKVVEKDHSSGKFLDRHFSNWEESDQSSAHVLESVLCPLLQVDVPYADFKAAYRFMVNMSQQLASSYFSEYFEMAESLRPNQMIGEDCDAAQCLQSFRDSGLESYFRHIVSDRGNVRWQRRVKVSRGFFLSATFSAAMSRMDDDDILPLCVFGVHSLAPSLFLRKSHKLLCDREKLIDPTPEDMKSIETLVKSISGAGDAALTAFTEDHLIVDLSDDIKNNTGHSLRHLNEYFNLCLCSTSDEVAV